MAVDNVEIQHSKFYCRAQTALTFSLWNSRLLLRQPLTGGHYYGSAMPSSGSSSQQALLPQRTGQTQASLWTRHRLFKCIVDCSVMFDAVLGQCNTLFLRSGVAEAVAKVTFSVQMCMSEVHQSTLRDGCCGLLSSNYSFSLVWLGCHALCLNMCFFDEAPAVQGHSMSQLRYGLPKLISTGGPRRSSSRRQTRPMSRLLLLLVFELSISSHDKARS